eukprot:gene4665-9255_t
MDLLTITKRVKLGYYGVDNDTFIGDIRLVWTNCTTFNGSQSEYGQNAL